MMSTYTELDKDIQRALIQFELIGAANIDQVHVHNISRIRFRQMEHARAQRIWGVRTLQKSTDIYLQ